MTTVQGEEQKRIGELIRQQRKKQKMTQKELGDALGVGMQAISDYENGKVKVIPYSKRIKIADLLNINIIELSYMSEIDFSGLYEKPIKKGKEAEAEIDNLLVNIQERIDEIKKDLKKDYPNENIDFYIYAALEKRLKESTTPPTNDTKK